MERSRSTLLDRSGSLKIRKDRRAARREKLAERRQSGIRVDARRGAKTVRTKPIRDGGRRAAGREKMSDRTQSGIRVGSRFVAKNWPNEANPEIGDSAQTVAKREFASKTRLASPRRTNPIRGGGTRFLGRFRRRSGRSQAAVCLAAFLRGWGWCFHRRWSQRYWLGSWRIRSSRTLV